MWRARTVVAVMALMLAGCSTESSSGTSPDSGDTSDSHSEPGHISQSDMGKKWPLKADTGELACDGSNGIGDVTFTAPDGTVYAVNGSAKSAGFDDIRPIWANDPKLGMGLKKDIGPLIQRGLALCD